jgi:aspartate/methionine/tyrosine aminotransferase
LPVAEALGRPQLRATIAEHYDQLYGLMVDPGQVALPTSAT